MVTNCFFEKMTTCGALCLYFIINIRKRNKQANHNLTHLSR